MFLMCYNYKKERIREATKLIEKAIFKDDYQYMLDTIKYTNGLHINYMFKTTILNINYTMSFIHLASRFNSVNCINSLIRNKASVNIYDGSGWLPIHYAAIHHQPYKNKSLRALLTAPNIKPCGITLNGKIIIFNRVKFNTKNKTAFELANHYLRYESCKIIEDYINDTFNMIQNRKYKNRIVPYAKVALICESIPTVPLIDKK